MGEITLYDELEEIRRQDPNGLLKPEAVVDYAENNEDSILNGSFEWDDSAAAYNYRLWQARQLIVRVTVEIAEETTIQAYVSLMRDRMNGGYRRMIDVFTDKGHRNNLLSEALAELTRVELKYKELKELEKVFAEIKVARQKVRV